MDDGRECRPYQASPGSGGGASRHATAGFLALGTPGVVHETPAGPEAVLLDANAAVGAEQLLTPVVAAHVPDGAVPAGALVAGQFDQGQSLRVPVTLSPGACYTVVAKALAPVVEVDLALTSAGGPPGVKPTSVKDAETGLVATIGKRPDCLRWASPASGSMTLTLTVPDGQGVAAAQVYEKR